MAVLFTKIENTGRGKICNEDHEFRYMHNDFEELISWSLDLGLRRDVSDSQR